MEVFYYLEWFVYFRKRPLVKKDLLIHTTYRMEVDNDGIYNIENILLDNGIEQKNIEVVKRSIIGIARDIPEKSREFEWVFIYCILRFLKYFLCLFCKDD